VAVSLTRLARLFVASCAFAVNPFKPWSEP
jgi:hypothetical protein